jgi:competence protein ComEC
MDLAFEEKSECILTGEITMIVKKSWGISYHLKDNRIILPNNGTYLLERIIVNTYESQVSEAQVSQTPMSQTPISQTPISQTPISQTPISQTPISQNPISHTSISHTSLSRAPLSQTPISCTPISQALISQAQVSQSQKYLIGNIVTISGLIKKFSINTNPGGFNEYLYYKSQNISYKLIAEDITIVDSGYSSFHNALNNIKEELVRVYNKLLPKKEAGTLMAMVLGEKYLLEDEVKTLYQENGISHILAISGLHVSMIGAAIYFILRKLRLGLITATIISLVFVYSYGILTNFSVSTNRAIVMYSILLLARLIGKTFDILSALSLSAFLILLQSPMELFQAGFLLSFGAVLGIALILPSLNSLYEPKNAILKGIYVSVSAQALTIPIVLYYFFQIPIYSVLVNLIILPLSSLLMLTALTAGLIGIVSMALGVFIAGGANYILIFYEMVCKLGANLPRNLITTGRPDSISILVYYAILLLFIISVRKLKKRRLILLFVAAIVLLLIPKSRDGITVAMLDVGQGEAIFIESDLGTTYLIDGGSSDVSQMGRYRIVPYLLSRGTDTLDYAIVSHTDKDHVSGLMELIEGKQISIKHLILPRTKVKNDIYQRLEAMATDNDIKLRYIVKDDMIIDGKLRMTFLHPTIEYQPTSNNDYSAVISISYDDFDMLLTGDLEAKGEKGLIRFLTSISDKVQTDYDVLKVAHHGSKNSTNEEILSIIKPEFSLISCGKNNRYGHPHVELLERLDDMGSEVVITYESGAITIKTDGKRMVVEEYLK